MTQKLPAVAAVAEGSPALRSFCTASLSMESLESSLPRSWDPTIAEAHVRWAHILGPGMMAL